MRKHIKNSSKRKWVVGGVAFFGAVALLTTGFASWVVGVNADGEGVVNVAVDTVETAEYMFDVVQSTDASIKLAETAVDTDGPLVTSNATDGDLKIGFTTLSVSIRNDIVDDAKYDSVVFTMTQNDEAKTAIPTATTSLLTGSDARTGSSWTYLDAPASIALSGLTSSEVGGYTTYTIATELSFSWGSFFGNVSPCNYYNALTDTSSSAKRAVASEMNTFAEAFADVVTNSIKLTISLHETI